jgi:hypothetical protein
MKRFELAALLGVSNTVIKKYLNPSYVGRVPYSVAKQVQSLRESRGGEQDPLSLVERFDVAARRLFGQYYYTGFATCDRRSASAVRRLSSLTGLTERTIYRHLPPYGPESNPPRTIVEAFELAARKLANLV